MSIDYRLGKPISKKITLAEIPKKYWPEWFVEMRKDENLVIDGITATKAIEAALNRMEREKQAKIDAKHDEEEKRLMKEHEKQTKERYERQKQMRARLPAVQL